MSKKIGLTRRQALAGLGTIGVASAGAGLGTTALFSDEESFEDNQLTAGTLDLKVDWQQTYDGPNGLEYVNAYPDEDGDGRQDEVRTRTAIADANPGWSDDEVESEFRSQFADLSEDFSEPLVSLDDVKPGDSGEVTFSFHLFDNPGYIWLLGDVRANEENGQPEPEVGALGDVGPATGELLDAIDAVVWYDDGNNVRDDTETLVTERTETTSSSVAVSKADATVVEGTLREVLEQLEEGAPLTADPTAEDRVCFPNSTTRHVGFAWEVPASVGNEIQTDSVEFDLGVYAEQCRNNDGTDNPVVDAVVPAGESVQSAVDAASAGDVIRVAPGTFTEQVVLDKPVTLLGAGPGQTTIESPTSLSESYTRNGDQEYPVVFVTATDAEVRHLTVDGARNGGGHQNFVGVGFVNAGGKVIDVEIANVTDDPFGGRQGGLGIFAYNGDGATRSVVVRGANVHDYQKGGVVAEGDGLEFTLLDSTVTGAGSTDTNGQNGVQVSGVASALIRGTTVRDNYYSGSRWVATGLVAYDADLIHVVESAFENNQFGIGAQNAEVVARRSNIVSGDAGIVTYAGPAVDARHNWWGASEGPSSAFGGGADPETGEPADGGGAGVYGSRWDPFASSQFSV
jgi:predicted ribosomally synthesized peptide with SipW-like signal peptide